MNSSQNLGYVNYIGNEVTVDASSTLLTGGRASWDYSLSEDATGTFEIRNAGGAVVYSGDISLEAGEGRFQWQGQTDSGAEAVDGVYSISFDVKDASSRNEKVSTVMSGTKLCARQWIVAAATASWMSKR